MRQQEDNKLGLTIGQQIEFKTAHIEGYGTIRQVYPNMVIVMTDGAREIRSERLLGNHYLTIFNCQVINESKA